MTIVQFLFAALVALFPRSPSMTCLRQRAQTIIDQATNAETRRGVPAGVLLAVGFMESHLGCDAESGGCWGAPVSRTQRHTAGTPDHAAQALATGFRVCGSWRGAISRFRCGLCRTPPRHEHYVNTALSVTRRLYARAQAPEPSQLEPVP